MTMKKSLTVSEAHKFLTEFMLREGIELVNDSTPKMNYSKSTTKTVKAVKVSPIKQIGLTSPSTVQGDKLILNNVLILGKKAYQAEKAKGTTMLTIVVIISQEQKDAITAFHKSN